MRSGRRTNVLDAATGLIGRADALRELDARLGSACRLVTLLGPAGVGKSRLALAFAAELSPSKYPGGVWHCDLSEVEDEAGVCAKVMALLGADWARAAPSAREVGELLSCAGRTFVLFDNVEATLAPLSSLLDVWLRAAPHLECLATSRERLGLNAETLFRVDPLGEDAAVVLLRERMDAVRGERVGANLSVLYAIVQRLDRLPLCIELAAPHLGALAPEELLDRLDPSLPFLTSSNRAAAPRARSLRRALDVSFAALGRAEQHALWAFAQFRGEFELSDAEAVFADPELPAAAALARLWNCSLLDREPGNGSTTFRIYRAVREYALERLAADSTADAVTAQFRSYMLENVGRRLVSDPDAASIAWLSRQGETLTLVARECLRRSELDEAATAAIAAGYAAALRGPIEPALSLLDDIALDGISDATQRCRTLQTRARLHARHGAADRARADLEAALAIARTLDGSAALVVSIQIDLGTYHRHHGGLPEARSAYEAALRSCATNADPKGRARVLAGLAGMAHEAGALAEARGMFEEALAATRAHSMPLTEATILQNLGTLLHELGLSHAAMECFESAIQAHRKLGHTRFEGIAEYDLASLALERGAVSRARDGFERGLRLAREVGDRREWGLCMALSAVCDAMTGNLARANERMDAAEAVLRALAQPALLLALQIQRGHLELAEAVQELYFGVGVVQHERLAAAVDRVTESAAESHGIGLDSDEIRYARRLLEAAQRRHAAIRDYAIVAGDGRWFRAGGARVDLAQRAPLQRLLAVLIRQRMTAPDEPVPVAAMIGAGWPGEKVVSKAGKNRLHVAIATLRKSGLELHLVRRGDGYLLERAMAWERSDV